jgi:hypothetical protein
MTVLLALSFAACDGRPSPDTSAPLSLDVSDVHVLGSSESIAMVRDLEVLPDGSVWLLNSVEPFFVGLDAEGTVVATHGSVGGGPEEFQRPAGFLTGGLDGEAWAFDFGRHAFVRISSPNGERSEVAIPREEVPPGTVRGGMNLLSPLVRTARLGDELIFPWTTGTMDSGVAAYHTALLRANVAALDPRTGSVREVVALGDVLDDPSEGFVATAGGFPLWYRLWAVCGEQLRVHDRVRNQLRGFTSAGEEVSPIDLPPVRFTEASRVEFARAVFPLRRAEVTGAVGERLTPEDSVRLLNQMAQALSGDPRELAAYLPRYVDFRCADDGTMWMQPIDLEIGGLNGGPAWIRIATDGAAREIHLPARFDALRFTPDRIWGVQRDELNVGSVAWIDLPVGL